MYHERSGHAEFVASEFAFGAMFQAMVDSGIPSDVAGHIVHHEWLHYSADEKKGGNIGFFVGGGYYVGYYQPDDNVHRTPKNMMEIALAPSDPSGQDLKVAAEAQGRMITEKNFANTIIAADMYNQMLHLREEGKYPSYDEVKKANYKNFYNDYSDLLKKIYEETKNRVEANMRFNKDKNAEKDTSDKSVMKHENSKDNQINAFSKPATSEISAVRNTDNETIKGGGDNPLIGENRSISTEIKDRTGQGGIAVGIFGRGSIYISGNGVNN